MGTLCGGSGTRSARDSERTRADRATAAEDTAIRIHCYVRAFVCLYIVKFRTPRVRLDREIFPGNSMAGRGVTAGTGTKVGNARTHAHLRRGSSGEISSVVLSKTRYAFLSCAYVEPCCVIAYADELCVCC